MANLYGTDKRAGLAEYESPDEYADQGDTRVIKHLLFSYVVEAPNPYDTGGPTIQAERVARRSDVVTVDQIGLIALEKGERLGSFYTTDELESLVTHGTERPMLAAGGENLSSLGATELAEWLQDEKPTVNQVLEAVGNDRDFAQRMLEAENIATSGDPRAGVEKGLTRIIEES